MKKHFLTLILTLFSFIFIYSQRDGELTPFETNQISERVALENEIMDLSKDLRKLKDSIVMIELSGHPRNSSISISAQDSITLSNNQYFNSQINIILPNLRLKSKTYLNTYWSITDQDLLTIDNNLNSDNIILYALSCIELLKRYPNYLDPIEFPSLHLEQIISSGNYLSNNTNIALRENQELTWSEVALCAAAAIGVDFVFGLSALSPTQGNKWVKKAILKAFGKIASRMLGPVGAVLAVGSFSYCMVEQAND